MKAYGLNRIEAGDTDVAGCINGGRATRLGHLKEHTFRSLRGGCKSKHRRIHKRRARAESKELCSETE